MELTWWEKRTNSCKLFSDFIRTKDTSIPQFKTVNKCINNSTRGTEGRRSSERTQYGMLGYVMLLSVAIYAQSVLE